MSKQLYLPPGTPLPEMPSFSAEKLNQLLKEMLDEWLARWIAYRGVSEVDLERPEHGNQSTPRFQYLSQRGDTRDVWSSIAEFDDQLTAFVGTRTRVYWRIRPRWTNHFVIECELGADWGD